MIKLKIIKQDLKEFPYAVIGSESGIIIKEFLKRQSAYEYLEYIQKTEEK